MSPTNLRSPVWLRLRGALWVPAYLAVFALLEHLPRQHYWATQLPLDAVIPFCPVFVVFYCVWYVLLIGTGLFLLVRDGGAFRRYMQFLALTFFLSAAVWFLIPSCQNLRTAQMEESSIFTALLALLYRIDTNTNVFPSAHVVGAIGAALAVWDWQRPGRHRGALILTAVLAGLICLSTVLIKQHALLDVLGGLLLAAGAGWFVYRPVKSLSPNNQT